MAATVFGDGQVREEGLQLFCPHRRSIRPEQCMKEEDAGVVWLGKK